MWYQWEEKKEHKYVESADKNLSADSPKKEIKEIKKQVLTSSSLDVLETQIDHTLTWVDIKKWLESLGAEIDYSKINSKVENENKLTTLSDQVDIVLSNSDKKVDQIVEMHWEMPLEAMNTYVWFNIIWSLYAACMKKAWKLDGTIDTVMFDNMISWYDINTIAWLKNALTQSGAILDDREKQILTMLEWNSVFAQDYIAKEYGKVVSLMRKSIPNLLQQYNTYVVANPSTWKNWLDKTTQTLKNIWNKFMEHPVRNIALLTWGFLVGRWIYRKITGKKKKDGDEETKSSGFNKFLKWVLKVWGVTCVAVLLWKMLNGLSTGNPFNLNNQPGDVVDNWDKEKFMKLNPEEIKKYNDMADKINAYYADEIHGDNSIAWIEWDDDMFGESIYEKYDGIDIKWVVPYVIDKRYATLNDLISEEAIVMEIINGDINTLLASVRQWCWDKAELLLWPILWKIGNFPTIFGWKKWDTDAVFEWIKWNTEAQDQLRSMFVKIMKMSAYFKNRENELTKITSADFVKKEYLEKNILQAYTVLQEKWIEKAELDEEQKEVLESLIKMKTDYVEALKTLDGKNSFEKKDADDVVMICEDIIDQIDNTWKRNVLQRMASTLTWFSNSNEMALDQMLDGIWYSEMIKPYKEKITIIKEKATKWLLTPDDIKELHLIIDDYTKLMKDVMIWKMTIEEVKDENGSRLGRFWRWLKVNGKDMFVWFEMVLDGIADKDWTKLIWWTWIVASKAVVVYAVLHPKATITWAVKVSNKVIVWTYKAWQKIIIRTTPALWSRLSAQSMLRIFWAKNTMEMNNLIRVEFLKWSLSETQSMRILNKLGIKNALNHNSISSSEQLYQHIFGRVFSPLEVQVLQKYAKNDLIRSQLYTKNFAGTWTDWIKLRKKVNTDIFLQEENLKSLLKLDQSIVSLWSKPWVAADAITYTQKCATSLLRNTNDIGKATSMIEKMIANPMKWLIDAEKFGKMLGKNTSIIWEQWLIEINQFIQKAKLSNKIVSAEKFVLNTIKNYTKLKAVNFELSAIESLSLNKWRGARFVETTGKRSEWAKNSLLSIKEWLKKSPQWLTQAWTKLENTLKWVNPAKFPASIRSQATAQLNTAITSIDEWRVAINSLQDQLTIVRWQLQAAEETAETVAQIESKQISTLQKVFKNPVIKRLVKYSPALLELWFAAWWFAEMWSEIEEVRKRNISRADVKDDHRYFDMTASSVGATIIIIWIANWWNPVGWGTLAVWLAVEWVKKLSEWYYEVVESYYKNVEEFRREYMWTIKQELISKSASWQWVEISRKENHQQFWASIWWAFGIDTFTWQKKIWQTTITLENATRALIYMEEMERFPMADMDKNAFDWSTPEWKKLIDQIESDKKWILEAVTKRFAYILAQRPSLRDSKNPSFLSKEAFTDKWHALDEINILLANSRKYVRIDWKDIALYESAELQLLQQKKHDFDKYESLRKNNRRDMQCVAYWIDSYEWMMENYKDNNTQYNIIKDKIAYFKKYYWYKTFGYTSIDFPMMPEQLASLEPDMNMVENMILNGEITPTTMQKADILSSIQSGKTQIVDANQTAEVLSVSPVLWQQIFFRIAKEIMGYKWNNNIQELKLFYTEDKDDTNGIYHKGNSWYYNIVWLTDIKLCDDNQLHDWTVFQTMKWLLLKNKDWWNITTETRTGNSTINKEFALKKIAIINDELAMKTTQKQIYIKQSIENFVKERGKDWYIQLPPELVTEAIRAWMIDVWSCLYTFDGTKIICVALQYVQNSYRNNKHSLWYPIEFVETPNAWLDIKLNTLISITNNAHNELYRMVVEDKNSDFDFNSAIVSLVEQKSKSWNTLKQKIVASTWNNQADVEKMELMQKEFQNIFTTILSISSRGQSNDVDWTEHFEKILALQSIDFVSLSLDMANVWYIFADSELESEYTKELQKQCKKQLIPGTQKTIEDYFREWDSNQKKIATRAANIVMQSIMESAMLKYDATWKIIEIYWWWYRDINYKILPSYIKKRLTKENIWV